MYTIINDYNIRHCNTFRMNVSASKWIEYTSASDLPSIMAELNGERFRCIGEGSNMLFLGDFDGALLHSAILDVDTSVDGDGSTLIHIGSGVRLDDLIGMLAMAGVWGLENLSNIPGTAGSAAVQNVGAYGVEIKDFVESVECFDTTENRMVKLNRDECGFAYRDSIFKKPENRRRYIVTYLNLRLPKGLGPKLEYGNLKQSLSADRPTPLDVREAVIEMRSRKLPDVNETGSAGSFFKNPVVSEAKFAQLSSICDKEIPHYPAPGGIKIPAAWLIDQCGLKGASVGSAAVWQAQPLVIVNSDGRAAPADIVNLENKIVSEVETKFGIHLSPEVDHIK